jgi:hypothetical protein
MEGWALPEYLRFSNWFHLCTGNQNWIHSIVHETAILVIWGIFLGPKLKHLSLTIGRSQRTKWSLVLGLQPSNILPNAILFIPKGYGTTYTDTKKVLFLWMTIYNVRLWTSPSVKKSVFWPWVAIEPFAIATSDHAYHE